MPLSVPAMLRHAEWFSLADDTLRSAYNRAAAYFLTDVEVRGKLGSDEKKRQREYLVETAKIIPFMHAGGVDLLTYGNQYTSVFHPIMRYVSCPGMFREGDTPKRCGSRYRMGEFDTNPIFKFEWQSGIYGRCPRCGYSGVFHDRDRPPIDEPDTAKPLDLVSWNPHDIRIEYNDALKRSAAFEWVIPAEIRTEARMGRNKSFIEDTPWEWLMAASRDENVRFTPDLVHHWKEGCLGGIRSRGVGIPRAMVSYRRLLYHRMLQRMNEVLAYGHVVPMRVISPANTAGRAPEGDILKTGFMGNIKVRVNRMIAAWRQDPSSVQFAPVPLQFQSLGADARSLIPADIITQAQEGLLNGIDMPVDFYRANMTMQNAPAGLRLVEALWSQFVSGMNSTVNFIGQRAQFLLKWQAANYGLKPVTMVDSIEKSQLRVQMAQANLVSKSRALQEVGMDYEEEERQKLDDNRLSQRLQQEFEDENDAYAFSKELGNAQGGMPGAGGPPGGQGGDPNAAAPQGGGGGQPGQQPNSQDPLQSLVPQPGTRIDPTEFLGRAKQCAEYLLSVPEAQRYGMLRQIAEMNESFHGMVKSQLEKSRSQLRSRGSAMLQQQMQQGGQQGQ